MYCKEHHLLWALCHLLLRIEIQQSPAFLKIILSVYTWLSRTRVKTVPEGPCFGTLSSPGVSLPRPSSPALFQSIYIQFLHGPISGLPATKQGTLQRDSFYPCRGRLGNNHCGTCVKQEGSREPRGCARGFFWGSLPTQGDKMQQWWGARAWAELSREVLGEEIWEAAGQEERAASTEL